MLDFSNEIFNGVANDLRSLYSGIQIKGEYVSVPAKFPCATVDEISNTPAHLDSANTNKYAKVIYRVQVFSKSKTGKRQEARAIYGTIDEIMQRYGLVCVTYTTTPAIYNSEIYSITATYEGVIGEDGVIYRG